MQTISRALAPTHPLDLPATEIAAGIRARHFSAEAVVAESLRRAKIVNQSLNAFTLLREEAALASARAADELVATGGNTPVLLGVPFAAKDLTPTKGDLTTLGSWTRGIGFQQRLRCASSGSRTPARSSSARRRRRNSPIPVSRRAHDGA